MVTSRPTPPNRDRSNSPHYRGDQRNQISSRNSNQVQPRLRQNNHNSESTYFHNPYNFVPAVPRQSVTGELGDRSPHGHSSYLEHHWSGRIRITLITITPLLIPDASQVQQWGENQHKTYPLRLVNEIPYLPPTSIKGSLRAAYEAVTNSKLSIFSKHDSELAYRMVPDFRIKAAIVIRRRQDGQLLLKIMEIAKLLCYKNYDEDATAPTDKGASEIASECDYPNHSTPNHGDLLWVQLNPGRAKKVARFEPRQPNERLRNGWQKGWACITGPNCKEKRFERIFLEPSTEKLYELGQREIELWEKLIADYQTIHEDDLKARLENHQVFDAYLGQEPGQTGWSRHIYTNKATKLKPGTLCYVQLNSEEEITALLPVTISRQLFQHTPAALLSDSLKPATKLDELSPVDRVFGWVNQNGNGSYRGQLRIHSVQCLSNEAIQSFTENSQVSPGLPLTILGEPKSQQARFYVSSNPKTGEPLSNGKPKSEGYQSTDQGLRGRKIYPHHKAIAHNSDYWDDAMSDRTDTPINGYYQEYRRPEKQGNEQRDSQNRSIQAWVKPNTPFQFEIDVINLSDVELGALLWLLQLPDDHYHRLGGGKPLGFGSVQLAIDWKKTDLRTGQQWKNYYESLLPTEIPSPREAENCIQEFENEVGRVYGEGADRASFEAVHFIQAFRQAAKGLDLPIHYPRLHPQPNPEGENFKWFTTNEAGEKRSLPPLWNEQGLPYLEPQ